MFADPLLSQRIDEEKSNYSTFGRGRKAASGRSATVVSRPITVSRPAP